MPKGIASLFISCEQQRGGAAVAVGKDAGAAGQDGSAEGDGGDPEAADGGGGKGEQSGVAEQPAERGV